MAEEKKEPSLPAPFHPEHRWDTLIMLLVLMVIGAIYQNLKYYFQSGTAIDFYNIWGMIIVWFTRFSFVFKFLAVVLALLAILWMIYNHYKLKQIEKAEEKIYGGISDDVFLSEDAGSAQKENGKWTKVMEHLNSNFPADWRLAIVEADIMLDELLTASGYHGDSIGEKLKTVEPSDMLTLEAAWEAHKVRNRIAHSGSAFELNEREAKRVIALFESVFKEFEII